MLELVEYSGHCFVSIKFKHTVLDKSFVHMIYVYIDIARLEAANKSRIAPIQTATKPVENSSEEWCQEKNHSLTSNQKT